MQPSPADWHARYLEQARWTAELRARLFDRANIGDARRILEVGCGTGAVLSTIAPIPAARLFGLDQDAPSLIRAHTLAPGARLAAGDAAALPFAPASFDIVFSHFLFLWLAAPLNALAEMRRAARPGGAVISLAEPDYDARIDYPESLAEPGRRQRDELARQGADPAIGRKVGALMAEAGLRVVETGILGGRWTFPADEPTRAAELDILRRDIREGYNRPQWEELAENYEAAWRSGSRVLFVPTFYALAFRED
jgi:SAM-dependent methyltransferase